MYRWILWGLGLLVLLAVTWVWLDEPGATETEPPSAVDRTDTLPAAGELTQAARELRHDSVRDPDTSPVQASHPLTVRGQLIDAEDGRPVASARIELLRFSESTDGRRYDPSPVVTRPGADGSFTAELRAPGSFEVFLIGEYHLELGQRILAIDDDEVVPPWELKPSGSLEARVVLPSGAPANGAWIELLRQPYRPGSQRLRRVPRLIGEDPRPQPDRAVAAKEDGVARLQWLPPGEYRAIARAELASDSLASDFRISARRATEIVFQLEAAARIRGKVVQTPIPADQQEKVVWLHREPESVQWDESGGTFERTTANRLGGAEREIPILEGRFDSGPVPAGRYRVHLGTVWQRLVLEPGEERTITLGPAESLRRAEVRVVDDSRRPVSGIPVQVRQIVPHVDDSRLHVDQALGERTTDEGGRFTLLVASEATIQLETAPPGFRPHVELLPSDATDHEMVLSPVAIVRGRVLDPDGAPVQGVMVTESARRLDIAIAHYRKMSTQTDDDGRFELAVTPGWTVLSVQGNGDFLPLRYEVALEAGATQECTLHLERGGFLAGSVRNFEPEVGGRVRADAADGTPFLGRVDEAGRFQIKGLPAGMVVYSYRTLEGSYFEVGEAWIAPGEITEVEIEIPPPWELIGQVLDASDAGIAGCQIELSKQKWTSRWATSDSSGAFRFELRERGELTLRAFAPRPAEVSLWMPKELLAEAVVYAPSDVRQLEVILKAATDVDLMELRGIVRRGESAAPNAIVAFSSNLAVTETQSAEVATTTDELGAFRLSVPSSAGVLLVLPKTSGALPHRHPIDPRIASQAPIEISLPGGSLRGRAPDVLPDGRTHVALRRHGDVDLFARLALSDSTFTFTDLPPGSYDVWLSSDSSVALETGIEVLENEVVDIGDLEPSPLAWSLVRVRSPDGQVLRGARYFATPIGRGVWTGLVGGQNGEAEIRGVAGRYRLEVTCDGYESRATTIHLEHAPRPPVEIVLTPR